MAGATLYTPEVLVLAVDLAAFPFDPQLPFQAEVRSPTCGSSLRLGLACDAQARVSRVGVAAQACAIGQAAAALFARGAVGRSLAEIELAGQGIRAWLAGEGELPAWPGFAALSAIPAYPGRHGAVMLAWNGAREALSTSHA